MNKYIINQFKNGKIGVIPTDTIYGIVGSALNQKTVEKIYKLKKRSKNKLLIILISSLNDLKKFDIPLTKLQENFLEKNWPNPLSVVISGIAFRMPKNSKLLDLLKQTGPLVAPSANPEGEKPAETIAEVKKYFGSNVDFYVDGGEIKSAPSTLIELNHGAKIKLLRQGIYRV